nr:methyl-accepting chemotaxis protein [uncultured Carboxylicivirga sp.]
MIKMTFRTKLILVVFVPLFMATGIAIYISATMLKHQGMETLERKTKAILTRMEAVRTYVAHQFDFSDEQNKVKMNHPDGNLTSAAKDSVLRKVPIFASMAVGKDNAEKDSYAFRVASLKARNKENKATALETDFINQFKGDPSLEDLTYTNKETNELWVMRPVRLSEEQGCLHCHGHPSRSPWGNGKDILGYKMENYADGDMVGMFVLKSSLNANNNEVQANIKSAIWRITITMLIILLLVVIFSSLFIRSTNTKIQNIIKINKRIANGDLTQKLEVKGNDEFSEINRNLNQMTESLTNVVQSVIETSKQLNSESLSTTKLSKQLAESSNSQAAAVEEISVSVEEISASIESNSDHARTTEKVAMTSSAEMEASNQSSHQAIKSMMAIKEELKAISEIAMQTNILALNANVEAARAGSAGSGFAVVAGEVRKLAEKSKLSAESIESLFSSGLETVEDTGNKIAILVPEIKKTSGLVAEIVASSLEQKTAASEVNNAIQGLNTSTQTNAFIAENMSAKAAELQQYADMLDKQVAFFKLKNND